MNSDLRTAFNTLRSGRQGSSAVAGGTQSFANERDPEPAQQGYDANLHKDITKSTVSPWAAVGGASDQLRLNQQILAASDPKEYGRTRDEALKRVREMVEAYYKLSLHSFLSAGHDMRDAENKALAATSRVKQIEMDQFHLMFPEADLSKYIGATAHDSNAYYSAGAIKGTRKKRTTRKKK